MSERTLASPDEDTLIRCAAKSVGVRVQGEHKLCWCVVIAKEAYYADSLPIVSSLRRLWCTSTQVSM
jgi:hypothetical protein